jgi:hypothetical protein
MVLHHVCEYCKDNGTINYVHALPGFMFWTAKCIGGAFQMSDNMFRVVVGKLQALSSKVNAGL